MKKKILLTYTNFSTFVKTDYEILSSEHEVIKYQFKPDKGLPKTAFQFLKQLFYLVFNIWKFDVVFVWFADYHSFLPVLFAKLTGKKSFVVIGGYDVANMPEIGYGSLSSPMRKKLTLFTFKHVSLCLSVVDELEKKIKEICPAANSKTIYTGYKFKSVDEQPDFEKEREKCILTVSITDNWQRVQIKGLDRFKELAETLPEFQFYIIGVYEHARNLFNPAPSNLILLPPLQQSELTEYYIKASFYAQFSRSEGLPNALCEAMLFGCIPIGTRIGGITAAIENLGLLMDEWDAKVVAEYVKNNHNKALRETFSLKIKEKFDLSLRREKLLKEINQK